MPATAGEVRRTELPLWRSLGLDVKVAGPAAQHAIHLDLHGVISRRDVEVVTTIALTGPDDSAALLLPVDEDPRLARSARCRWSVSSEGGEQRTVTEDGHTLPRRAFLAVGLGTIRGEMSFPGSWRIRAGTDSWREVRPRARREVDRTVLRNAEGEVDLTRTSTEWAAAAAAASTAVNPAAVVHVRHVVRTRQSSSDAGPGFNSDSRKSQTTERWHGDGYSNEDALGHWDSFRATAFARVAAASTLSIRPLQRNRVIPYIFNHSTTTVNHLVAP